jgi:hypothetical protein
MPSQPSGSSLREWYKSWYQSGVEVDCTLFGMTRSSSRVNTRVIPPPTTHELDGTAGRDARCHMRAHAAWSVRVGVTVATTEPPHVRQAETVAPDHAPRDPRPDGFPAPGGHSVAFADRSQWRSHCCPPPVGRSLPSRSSPSLGFFRPQPTAPTGRRMAPNHVLIVIGVPLMHRSSASVRSVLWSCEPRPLRTPQR